LSIEFLNELEDKVQALITALENVRNENTRLTQELEQRGGRISELETENDQLKGEIELLKENSNGQQEKLNITTERIQGLLARLETVQH